MSQRQCERPHEREYPDCFIEAGCIRCSVQIIVIDKPCPKCHGKTTFREGKLKCIGCGHEFIPEEMNNEPKTALSE